MPQQQPEAGARRWNTSIAVALWILATIATVLFLRWASQLLIPIVLAVLISYALEPVVAWLARHKVPRMAGTSLILLAILGLGGWGLYSLRGGLREAIELLPEAARRARELVSSQSNSGPVTHLRQAAEELRGANEGWTGDQEPAEGGSARPSGQKPAEDDKETTAPTTGQKQAADDKGTAAPTTGQEPTPGGPGLGTGVTGMLQRGAVSAFSLAANLVVVFFLVFFLLASGQHFRGRLLEIAGPRLQRRRVTAAVVDDINRQVQRFLLVRVVTSIIVAALTWLILAWMGVQNAAVWGGLAGLFNSIPYFGPIIVSGGLLVVGLAQGGGMTQALQMSGAALAVTTIEGWLITPPLMGKAERMSAISVFVGLLVWTWIWGAWGTVLAVPMLVVLKSVADHVEPLKPIGRLMAP